MPFLLRDHEVVRVRDLPYVEGGGPRQHLDVYAPRGGVENAPVLLQIHGGAWTIGHKRQQALPLMLHLARRGWVCVAANYRLSPRATFPEHLIDVKQALRWVRENIAAHGGDPGFVAITGGSAGGHLCALTALTANRPEFQPGFEEVDTSVQAAVPFYGAYDFTNSQGHPMGAGLVSFLERVVLKKKLSDDPKAFEQASPLHQLSAAAPPFCVVHGTHDTLISITDAREFAARLREMSRAPVAFVELPGAQHAFELFHSPRTHRVIRGVHRFLGSVYSEHLRTQRKPEEERAVSARTRAVAAVAARQPGVRLRGRLRLRLRRASRPRCLPSPRGRRRSPKSSRPSIGRSTSKSGCPRSTPVSRARRPPPRWRCSPGP